MMVNCPKDDVKGGGGKVKTHSVVFETGNYLFSFSLMPVVDLYL